MQVAERVKPILVVEDEAIMRESLRDWLTDAGYQVETAEEEDKALNIIGEQDFSLLILDLRLPGGDGIDLLRQARARQPKIQGIIITAYPSVTTAVEAMKEGAVDYLTKPFDLKRLEESIRETLGPVQVEITVSESGKVIEAKAVSGHELLRDAAVEAAKQWEFKPTEVSGEPVKMQGILTFSFALQ